MAVGLGRSFLVVIRFWIFTLPPRDLVELRGLLRGIGLWAVLFGVVSLNWLRRARCLLGPEKFAN